MRQTQIIRSNTFQWALAVAGVFAVFVSVLFGFIYWQTDQYLIGRSDRMIANQLNVLAALPSGRRLVFSFLSNNMGSKSHEATDALDALSIAMIEEFDAAGSACCVKAQ